MYMYCSVHVHVEMHICVQWNLSNPDTIGTAQSVLIIEVSSFQSVLIREVPLYNNAHVQSARIL